ncbi:MAG: hypothetical protein IIB44_13090 [Candidatus Marinimicrobia bacterium]|nr:hypothetical protein [Candidatus Neomarinimicrobiota bacterium]
MRNQYENSENYIYTHFRCRNPSFGSSGSDYRYSLFLEGHRLIDMRHYGKTDELPIDRSGDIIVTFPLPETETPG